MYNAIDVQKLLKKYEGTPEANVLKQILGQAKVLTRNTPGIEYIKKAQEIITKDGFNPSVYYDKPYLLTTRNQNYLNTTLQDGAESAFVILSAGDTLFELVSRGVNRIVTVDVNDLQPLVFKLRKAAILSLKPAQFESFLVDKTGYRFMSKDIYKIVRDAFDKSDVETISFWDTIIDLNPQEDLREYLFKGVGAEISKVRSAVSFLKSKAKYYDLRNRLEKAEVTIKLEDAIEYLRNNPEQKFDYMDITNILLFIYQMQCDDDKERFYEVLKQVKQIYSTNLNAGGVFVIDYLFGVGLGDLDKAVIDDVSKKKVREIYRLTYDKLQELFELESTSVSKLIDGFGNSSDTVIYTKKPM